MTPTRQITSRRFRLRDEQGKILRAEKIVTQLYTKSLSSDGEWTSDKERFQLVDGRELKQISDWIYELVGTGERLSRVP